MKFNGECNLIGYYLKQFRLLYGKIYLNIEKLNFYDRVIEILKVFIVGNFECRFIFLLKLLQLSYLVGLC